jgi:hypothetical protein
MAEGACKASEVDNYVEKLGRSFKTLLKLFSQEQIKMLNSFFFYWKDV